MDYCSTCRRHLNGALVCPGCGAYAPDIAPSVMDGRTAPGPATRTAPPDAEATGGTEATEPVGTGAGTPPGIGTVADTDADLASASAMSAPTGRAARRRQLARWKKTQRRALVATAVALVGGGLTVASTDRGSGDRAQAATAPEVTGMGGAEEPTEQYGDPAPTATPPETHRPSPDRPARSAPDDAPDRRSTGAASTPADASDTRLDGATGAPATAPPPPRTASPSAGSGAEAGSGSAEGPGAASRPTTPPVEAPGSGRPGDRDGSQQPAAPDPSTPPPDSPSTPRSELCLLVICLG
ncbi:SCO2400 family protein [Streptomyces sp. NPDC004051]